MAAVNQPDIAATGAAAEPDSYCDYLDGIPFDVPGGSTTPCSISHEAPKGDNPGGAPA